MIVVSYKSGEWGIQKEDAIETSDHGDVYQGCFTTCSGKLIKPSFATHAADTS